jgi:predicted Zn-dependent protease
MTTDPLSVADQLLSAVRAEAGATAEAEVLVEQHEQALTRFANSVIHQNMADEAMTVRLRLHTDGRTATASSTVTSAEGLRDLAARTLAAARLCPPDAQWPGVAPAATVTESGPMDDATAYADPADRAARVRAFVDAADGLETAGYCRTNRVEAAFANTAGQSATGRAADAAMDAIARDRGADGVARLAAHRLADLDGAQLGARAAAKARAGVDPVELPPGRYEVVLEPTAVLDIVLALAMAGYNGKAVQERRSFVELGAAQLDPSITIVDELSGGLSLPFDTEGTPRRDTVLVRAGVSEAVAHDRRSAALAGTASTGHAGWGSASYGAMALNLLLRPSSTGGSLAAGVPAEVDGPAADAAVADLVAEVGRGLLVTDNWYTRLLDPRQLVLTGLTRNGVWLIEDGKVTSPVQNLRFTQSYPDALAPGAVRAIGAHAVCVPTGWGPLNYRVPALHLASWNYTGNAKG